MNLLITGVFKWNDEQINLLRESGYNIFYIENENNSINCDVSIIDVVVCNWLFVHHDIKLFKNLKIIQLLSAGFDRVPMDYIKKHDIKIYNARGVYSIPMAEFSVCGVLQLYKRSCFFIKNQQHHIWKKNRELEELTDKKICIVGTGSIGIEVAKRFSGFTEEIFGVDLCPSVKQFFKEIYPLDKLDEILRKSDIVILTLPLTDNTRGMFNEVRFSHFKKNSILVNISRGALVSENALLKALGTRLFGAVLDVFEKEPIDAANPLWNLPNVVITPHNSFVSNRNNERVWHLIWNNLIESKIGDKS